MNPENPESLPKKRLHWPTTPTGMSLVGFSQVGLFLIILFYVLHEMKAVLLPLVLAILVSLILHPVYVGFRKVKLPRMMSALLTVAGLSGLLAFGAYQALLPGAEWVRNVNQEELVRKVQAAFRPMKKVQEEIKEMAQRVEKATKDSSAPVTEANKITDEPLKGKPSNDGGKQDKLPGSIPETLHPAPINQAPFIDPPKVVKNPVKKPQGAPVMVEIHEDPVSMLLAETRDFGLGLIAFLLLILFTLAYGNRITRQLYEDERIATIMQRMGKDVSRYLFTITVINAGLGVAIGLAMWALGMPRPALWGVMGMVLNFIPYVGAVMGTFVIFMAAAVNFEKPTLVLAVPIVYFSLTAIEGNVITPMVLGKRFRINPLVVFVWIFAWAGFWGIAGMLIAMPALVIFKIVCENTEKMGQLRRLLSA